MKRLSLFLFLSLLLMSSSAYATNYSTITAPANQTNYYGNESILAQFTASEAISSWWINDTTRFSINGSGYLRNITKTPVGTYIINISANDTSNNIGSVLWQVTIWELDKYNFTGTFESGLEWIRLTLSHPFSSMDISTDNLSWNAVNGNITYDGYAVTPIARAIYLNTSNTYYFRAKNTTTNYGYLSVQTQTSGGGEEMLGLGVVLFILAVTGTLFYLPFKMQFSKNDIAQFVLSRACWTLAIFLMILNTAIIMTISEAEGLALSSELGTYLWIFGWGGYVLLAYMILSTLFRAMGMWKLEKKQRRTGV